MTGDSPHKIPLAEAATLTLRWRHNCPAGSMNAGRFDRIAFDNILAQPGCAGVRIYLGMHDQNDIAHANDASMWTFVLVGTDSKGNDITTIAGINGLADTDGDTEETPVPCPTSCDPDSPLNSPP